MSRRKIVKKNKDFEKIVYGIWFGEEMSSDRKKCYQDIVQNFEKEEIKFVLITEQNLKDYPKIVLHEGFQYLSATHKADYIRTALMHFYGGGYTDIKMCSTGWAKAFSDLYNSSKFGNGYPEISKEGVAFVSDKALYQKMTQNYSSLIGNVNYIFKKETTFTQQWYNNMIKLMDQKLSLLKQYPAKHARQNLYREDFSYPYPIGWTELLGCIFHPLCYKYSEKLSASYHFRIIIFFF